MGKSAKFYKRPTKKEKEGLAIKKLVEPAAIAKKSRKEAKTISVPASMFTNTKNKTTTPAPATADQDVEMDLQEVVQDKKEKKEKKEKEPELPDYVDLFSGKKTFKKIPKKRK